MVYPKRPFKVYVSCMDYHIEECRKWFRTSMEFTARTFTTNRIQKRKEKQTPKNVTNGNVCFHDPDGPGASQIYLPRYNRAKIEDNYNEVIQNINMVNGGLMNGEISSEHSELMNGHLVNDDFMNGDVLIHVPGIQSHRWV